jgi:hypothetical protein
MIHMKLYEEEVSGARWPEKVNTRGPARCHVTRRRAQRDCPSTPPTNIYYIIIVSSELIYYLPILLTVY